ncbi:MAG: hypothetical protein U0031_00070 [Thermomicrobiales bacterium]
MQRNEWRISLLEEHPWLTEQDRQMVIGTDLDALMSATLLHQFFGWEIVGVYDLTRIYGAESASMADLRNAVWVDLDVNQADIKSIGHHIITLDESDRPRGLANSVNPNLIHGISHKNFRHKYPLGTVHFLMYLHDIAPPGNATDQLLFWLPDSSWINAQSHRFQWNVKAWLQSWLPIPLLRNSVLACDTLQFELAMAEFIDDFASNVRIPKGEGQVASRELGVGGGQFGFSDGKWVSEDVQPVLDFIGELTGWGIPRVPSEFWKKAGSRTVIKQDPAGVGRGPEVFSYAYPYPNCVNRTIFLAD